MKTFGHIFVLAACAAGASLAQAGTVTFDDYYAEVVANTYNGWGHVADAPAGGLVVQPEPGITATITPATGTATLHMMKYNDVSTPSYNDHTSGGTSPQGINIYVYDAANEGASTMVINFSQQVLVPSFWVTILAGTTSVTATGFDGATQVGQQSVEPGAHGYFDIAIIDSYREITAFAATPVTRIEVSGYFTQMDDLTAVAVPEPTSFGLAALVGSFLMKRRRAI